jgi:hypothetical protein
MRERKCRQDAGDARHLQRPKPGTRGHSILCRSACVHTIRKRVQRGRFSPYADRTSNRLRSCRRTLTRRPNSCMVRGNGACTHNLWVLACGRVRSRAVGRACSLAVVSFAFAPISSGARAFDFAIHPDVVTDDTPTLFQNEVERWLQSEIERSARVDLLAGLDLTWITQRDIERARELSPMPGAISQSIRLRFESTSRWRVDEDTYR